MVTVFDASVIFSLLVEEEKSPQAEIAFENASDVLILDFLHIEIGNSLASSVRRKRITLEQAGKARSKALALAPPTVEASQFLDDAFALALAIHHPIYDCLYAVAARTNTASLVTCDAKFAAKLDPAIYSVQVL
jgi:predicted nucleic acid-binding protein